MNLEKVTYLSLVLNESEKKYQDIDSILRIGQNSSKGLNFGKKIIYTYKEPTIDPGDFEIKLVEKLDVWGVGDTGIKFYSDCFDTDFMINFHCDGFIQNPSAWDDNFLNYDYIGAPICPSGAFPLVGNGGFSLRSKKLCEKVKKLKDINYLPKYLSCFNGDFISEDFYQKLPFYYRHEDVYICLFCKDILTSYGFKFPDLNIATRFSTEHLAVINNSFVQNEDVFNSSFGLHEIETISNDSIKNKRKEILEIMNTTV